MFLCGFFSWLGMESRPALSVSGYIIMAILDHSWQFPIQILPILCKGPSFNLTMLYHERCKSSLLLLLIILFALFFFLLFDCTIFRYHSQSKIVSYFFCTRGFICRTHVVLSYTYVTIPSWLAKIITEQLFYYIANIFSHRIHRWSVY